MKSGMVEQELTQANCCEDEIQQMLLLAARLREAHGEELDDNAIQAVAEATGAPIDYVRIALSSVQTKKRVGLVSRWRSLYLSFDPDLRRYVVSAWLASMAGMLSAVGNTFGDRSSFLGILCVLTVLGGVWNAAQARNSRIGAASGALFGGLWFVTQSAFLFLFSFFTKVPQGPEPFVLLIFLAVGSLVGGLAKQLLNKSLFRIGVRDRAEDRQDLLRQLVELQDRLRTGERSMTFLSLDVVGSTKMKEDADPLEVEFTFNEYHRYVETVVLRHGGQIHSTAGDGVTCSFEDPQAAFRAARNLQSGLIELNTHRNRIGMPITLRIGVHTGTVIAPNEDIQAVNFAHVIDIAAHLQKVCPPGGVAVSETTAMLLPEGRAGVGEATVMAQNVEAVVWTPRVLLPTLPQSA